MNKTILVFATVFTTFVLLSVAGIAYAANTAPVTSTSQPLAGGQTLSSDREAAYQAQIEEANQRLLEAQATQQELEAQINMLQSALQDASNGVLLFDNGQTQGERGRGNRLLRLFNENGGD